MEAFIQKIVEPYLSPGIDRARQAELQATVDEAISGQMRAILHHPRFQAAEAAWRAVFFLVRRLETGADLQLYLVDVTKEELAADLAAADDVRDTGLWRLLFERETGARAGQPWGILAGLYAFGPEARDVGLLWRLAGLARRTNAPFLAEASPSLLGTSSLAEAPAPRDWKPLDARDEENWRTLRGVPEAAYLGLALPRMLLRPPYGKEGSTVEEFDFEEMPPGSPHEAYLWGSPAVACAYLLAEAFGRRGWELRPGDVREITGLPLHVYREDGEAQAKPCAEVVLSDRAVEAILERGLMPLLSLPGQEAVRLARFQSLSAASPALAGGWS
jgi:type VI secretion system protein ImpC